MHVFPIVFQVAWVLHQILAFAFELHLPTLAMFCCWHFLFKKDSFLTLNELYRHKMERRPIVFNTGIKELKMGALHYSEKFSRSENAFYGDISDPVNRYFDGYICLSRRSIGRRKSIVLNNINNTGIRQ